MSIQEALEKDIITAMKARDEHRLTTLRMVKSALRSKEIDKRQPLTDAEALQILTTLIKQRKDSIEQFTKGGRPELAAKEAVEVTYIEAYMPQSASEDRVRELVNGALAQLAANNNGVKPGPKDMGTAMKVVQQHIAASGLRADGKLVSELVKAALAG
ncbi:MAG: GatB/YqeY domain-containing protein [Acidobacteriaceae bacterium]